MTVQAEKMTFTSRNGFREGVTHDLDLALQFFATHKATYLFGNNYGGMDESLANAVACLRNSHDRLQGATGIGKQFNPDFDVVKTAPSRAFTDSDAASLTFVRGAVCDPFLYSEDQDDQQGFQQGAVLNLRKAQTILGYMVERLTKETT